MLPRCNESCITQSVGDISHNARFTHMADRRSCMARHICSRQRAMAASRCRSTLTAVVRVSMSYAS